jgi:hypothetical protein
MPLHRPAALPLAALAALAPPAAARRALAQDTPAGQRPSRVTVVGYLAQARLDGATVGGDRESLGGYGARVRFNRSTPAAALRTFFDRASVGAFATVTAAQGSRGVRTGHYGLEADVGLFPAPILRGAFDPLLSLGAGALRTSSVRPGVRGRRVDTRLAVTPGIGARVPLLGGLALRGDLRTPVVFGGSITLNLVAEGGVQLSF